MVDDDPNLLFVLEKQLTHAGFDVATEVNALQAVLVAKLQRLDLILMVSTMKSLS